MIRCLAASLNVNIEVFQRPLMLGRSVACFWFLLRSLVICGASSRSLDGSLHFTQYISPVAFPFTLTSTLQPTDARNEEIFRSYRLTQLSPEPNFLHLCVFFISFRRLAINGECLWRSTEAQASVSHSTLAPGFTGKHKAAFVLLCLFDCFSILNIM